MQASSPPPRRALVANPRMAAMPSAAFNFTARRQAAVLVAPAAPTPRELKLLSDIDDQDGLRFQVPVIHFYRRWDASSTDGGGDRRDDPAPVIRDAVAGALVHYYPLAGRLRELEGRKLAVDCTGEGVLFVEADADVRLEHFGDALHPPFPCLDELLFDVPGSSAIVNTPLLLIQVTRLACGGFVVAVRLNHAMADAQGLLQFLEAVAELARGVAAAPTVRPVWERHLLAARDPPRPSFPHPEYDVVESPPDDTTVPPDAMARRAFFFGPREFAAIRAHLPPDLQARATTFELLLGFLWRCRTVALSPDAGAEVRAGLVASARGGGKAGLRIPDGYYGNSFALPVAIATAGELVARPVGHAVELVRKAKAEVGAEYMRSVADHMVVHGRPNYSAARTYLVSDLTRVGFGGVDYGWGTPVYGGAASLGPIPGCSSFFVPVRNGKGEDGVVVPMWLPGPAMDRFADEVGKVVCPSAAEVVPVPQRRHGAFPHQRSAL